MNPYIYDIEIFHNFFCCTLLNINDPKEIRTFIISWELHIDEKDKLQSFLDNNVNLMVGYNNIYFDSPVLSFVLSYIGSDINEDIYNLSQKIINSDRGENFTNRKNHYLPQMDLMKIEAFDKVGVSLKQCAINLKWKKIQDLPLPYDHVVRREDIEIIIKYNINDVLITYELYKKLQPQIQMRTELSKIYDVDLTNASDSKIANEILEKIYSTETGLDISDLKNLRTKRDFLWLKDCICAGIKFKTKKLRNLKFETSNTLVVAENNFAYKKKLQFGNCNFELGIGGLHSEDESGRFITDDKYKIINLDISSFYPNIIINNKIIPNHLSEDFIGILKRITQERLDAKKKDKKGAKATGLKITINSIFGKLGSETFWLEDAKAMLTVTVSGQLLLLTLIEELALNNIEVISANTDGIVCKVPRELENKYYEICREWTNQYNFELEFNDYDLYIRSDVNNYITKKSTGDIEEKGRYLREIELKKGYRYPIVAEAMYQYFVNNIPLDDTLHNAKDILDFCISQKSGKDFHIELRNDEEIKQLQKTNRFYAAKEGGYLIKVNADTQKEIGIYVGQKVQILNDYDDTIPMSDYPIDFDWYRNEAQKYINEIESATYPTELKQEELSTDEVDGIELDIDNLDTSKITIKNPRFRYSQAGYFFDKKESAIYRGIGGIKFITPAVADELDKVNKNYYFTFVDLLIDIEENCHINSRQMETLIWLNYFEEFECNQKLLDIWKEFEKGTNRYNKKLKIESKQKRVNQLKEFEKNCPNKKINALDQINYEFDLLNYVQTTFPVDKRFVYIQNLNTKYSPRLNLHCLATGKTQEIKIQNKIYENNIVLGGDIIFCKTFEHKKAVKFIDGEFIEDENRPMVWWLSNYNVLSKDEIAKLA